MQYLAQDPANTIIGLVRDKASADKSAAADGLKNVTMLQADISDRKSLVAARDQVGKITGGSVDYLINNAAYIDPVSEGRGLDDFEEDPEVLEQELVKSFQVNVVGVVNTINVFLPLVKAGAVKKVVVISSGMADPDLVNGGGIFNSAPYTISKAAANMVVFKYNARYKDKGVLFFALSPGVVKTWSGDEENAAIQDLRKLMPDWAGPLTPLESAEMCIKVTKDFSLEKGNGGAFVSHLGTKQWL